MSTAPGFVVGIGASAGGLQAASALLADVTPDATTAFVLVMHLDPDRTSQMAELMQRSTRLTVVEVRETTTLVADHLYVLAPGFRATLVGAVLELDAIHGHPGTEMIIDGLFLSMAETHGERCAGIALSGGGSDGVAGLHRIMAARGLVLVQNPQEADFDTMPLAALKATTARSRDSGQWRQSLGECRRHGSRRRRRAGSGGVRGCHRAPRLQAGIDGSCGRTADAITAQGRMDHVAWPRSARQPVRRGTHRCRKTRNRQQAARSGRTAARCGGGVSFKAETTSEPAAGFPGPFRCVIVLGDRTRLIEVADNLITNASKHIPSKGEIRVCITATDGWGQFSVQDNGVGITVDLMPRIFEMFSQGERGENTGPGLGLGLPLVKQLVELHAGEVDARSEGEGRGSEFVVRLPLAAEGSAITVAEPAPATGARRILVVDDHCDAADEWLTRLEPIVQEELRDIFPTEQYLDHIPSMIEAIGTLLATPDENVNLLNSTISRKALELGSLRYQQQATVSQLLRESDILATILEEFIRLTSNKYQGDMSIDDAIALTERDIAQRYCGELGTVSTETGKLRLILTNLITNSIKYSDPEKPDRVIEISREDRPDQVITLSVRDNSLGIPADKIDDVQSLRVRAHSELDVDNDVSGQRIGLYLVSEAVRDLEGSVQLEAEEGSYTRVTIHCQPQSLSNADR